MIKFSEEGKKIFAAMTFSKFKKVPLIKREISKGADADKLYESVGGKIQKESKQ